MGQSYGFSFSDYLLAEVGGVNLNRLHDDADAVIHCYAAVKPLAARLGVPAPLPHIAGFAYPHVAALGANIIFADDSEPKAEILIDTADDIDRLFNRNVDLYRDLGLSLSKAKEILLAIKARKEKLGGEVIGYIW